MVIQKMLLTHREIADVNHSVGCHFHSVQRRRMSDRRSDQRAGILEADGAAIEQMIHRRRQEKPVLTIQTFFICGIPPRLTVTRSQVAKREMEIQFESLLGRLRPAPKVLAEFPEDRH